MSKNLELFMNVAKLIKSGKNLQALELIADNFLVAPYDLGAAIEQMYTYGVSNHKVRSNMAAVVAGKGDVAAVVDWLKGKLGVTDEEVAAQEAADATYAEGMYQLALKDEAKGCKFTVKTYLELAAAKGHKAAIAKLVYPECMYEMGLKDEAKGCHFTTKTYFELAAAQGHAGAAAKLAQIKKDEIYAQSMYQMALKDEAKGCKVTVKTYLELAAAKGMSMAICKLAQYK